nr:hypothetical protein GCM10020241_15680 [Streptoalloteichus tenebrarius]
MQRGVRVVDGALVRRADRTTVLVQQHHPFGWGGSGHVSSSTSTDRGDPAGGGYAAWRPSCHSADTGPMTG